MSTSLMNLLGIAHPIIQAPMGGGATTPALVAAVSEAGALGFIGAPYLSADRGSEAGAHRGSFDPGTGFEAAMIGTMALVPQVVDAVRVPVVASGGIMDGRGIAAALALGAEAVQMGTAFLTTTESGIPPAYKDA